MNKKPVSVSWIDKLVDWLETRQTSPWIIYISLFILFALLNNLVGNASNGFSEFRLDILETTDAFYFVGFLAFYHYLKNTSSNTFDRFSENFNQSPESLKREKLAFSNIKSWQGYLALALGAFVIINDVVANPLDNGIFEGVGPIVIFYRIVPRIVAFSIMVALAIFVIHQLRRIQGFHKEASNLSIFRLESAHAFSDQTAAIGIFFIFFSVFRVLQEGGISSDEIIGHTVSLALAVSAFVGPLLGLRNKLDGLKRSKLGNYSITMERIFMESSDLLDSGDYKKLAEINVAINNLKSKIDYVNSISTLPWNSAALTNFIGSVFLPILIWLITRFLENTL